MSEEARVIMERLAGFAEFSEEVQLLDYGETAGGGPYLKFRLADPEQLSCFRGKPRHAKHTLGQRYACLLIPINDDESVGPPQKEAVANTEAMTASVLAFTMCRNKKFQQHPSVHTLGTEVSEENAAAWVKRTCGISSRKELDDPLNREAIVKFRTVVIPIYRECTGGG